MVRGPLRQVTSQRPLQSLIREDEHGKHMTPGAIGDLFRSASRRLLLERINEFDGREQTNASLVMLDALHADRGGDMGLSSAGFHGCEFIEGPCGVFRKGVVALDIGLSVHG